MFDNVCVVINCASNFVSECLGLVSVRSQLCVLSCGVCEVVYVVCVVKVSVCAQCGCQPFV